MCCFPQVDPLNLPVAVSSEDYVPPEDVVFEQVWDPSCVRTVSKRPTAPNPEDLVEEFAGAVSHDKVRGTTPCCGVFLQGVGGNEVLLLYHTVFPVAHTTAVVQQQRAPFNFREGNVCRAYTKALLQSIIGIFFESAKLPEPANQPWCPLPHNVLSTKVSGDPLPLRRRSRRGSQDAEGPPALVEGPLPGCGDVDERDGGGKGGGGERHLRAPGRGTAVVLEDASGEPQEK